MIIQIPDCLARIKITQLAKMLCLSYYAYVLSLRAERDLPETEEGRGERVGEGGRVEK
jgi:hypothetical protein